MSVIAGHVVDAEVMPQQLYPTCAERGAEASFLAWGVGFPGKCSREDRPSERARATREPQGGHCLPPSWTKRETWLQ